MMQSIPFQGIFAYSILDESAYWNYVNPKNISTL